jgi:4-amino-4-deoxy-L-arabinose transferase-like glycosyltransferase
MKVWFWVAVGAAAIIRITGLDRDSFWTDEFASWWATTSFERAAASERSNPPLYYILLYFWTRWAGVTEVGLRSFSVLPSVASLFLVYWLGQRLLDRTMALAAVTLMAFSAFQVEYAQEARTHSWLMFSVLGATCLLWKSWETAAFATRWRWWAGYVLLAAWCFYLHYISPLFFAAHGLFTVWLAMRGRQPARVVIEHVTAGVLAALLFLPQLLFVSSGQADPNRPWRLFALKVPQTYFSLLFGDTLIPLDETAVRDVRGTLLAYAPHLAAACLACLLLLPMVWRVARRGTGPALLVWMSTGPLLLAVLVSLKQLVLDERYMLSMTPFLSLLLAGAMVEAARRKQRWALAGAVIFTGLVLLALWQNYFHERFGREQWREAIAQLQKQADPRRDLIALDPDFLHYPFLCYGRPGLAPISRLLEPERSALLRDGADALGKPGRIFLVRCHQVDDQVLKALERSRGPGRRTFYPKGWGIEVFEFPAKSP